MADSTVREQIIETLRERLATYDWQVFDPTIWVGRSTFDPESERLPVVTLLPGQEESEPTPYGADHITMPVDVSALVSLEDGQEASTYGEPVFGELRKAVFSGNGIYIAYGEEYFSLSYGGGGIVGYPDELGPAVITVGLNLQVIYKTNKADPYNYM